MTTREREIHSINAIGPFVHGVWGNQSENIGDEEALTGRARAIIENFKYVMLSKYSIEEIKSFSLVDIGCYDGYLTTEIEKILPFKKIVGIEPRTKNIGKGIKIRKYLNLHTQIDFRVGDINSITQEGEVFDIVFCSGVLHHIENITEVLRKFKKITKKGIFIECQCYSSLTNNKFIKKLVDNFYNKVIEPKDIIYRFIPKLIGMCGYKIETDYYDGSANGLSVVCVPSPAYLQTSLVGVGFSNPEITLEPQDYRRKIFSQLRNYRAVCVFANSEASGDITSKINFYAQSYERDMITKILSKNLLNKMGKLKIEKINLNLFFQLLIKKQFNRNLQKIVNKIIEMMGKDNLSIEILKNIKNKPKDKINFEYAKYKISIGDLDLGIEILLKIVGELNADWRTCYRTFALLAIIYRQQGVISNYTYFRDLLLIANPNYPINILEEEFSELFAPTPQPHA
ncbi:AdoMet_MTases domain containing protein [Candidatus Methylopumilus universalis]|uniref:class I SAM-dependent methyltransferase n=1 Tax=Candidatus Methylopumilus universalis TaxID=2588536 RepID=UPI003BEEB62B